MTVMPRLVNAPGMTSSALTACSANSAARSVSSEGYGSPRRRRSSDIAPIDAPRLSAGKAPPIEPAAEWDLHLYVAGQSPRSAADLANLRKLFEVRLAG